MPINNLFIHTYYICDVIIDENHRHKGLGKKLMEAIESCQEFCNFRGILATRDAHGLYAKYGFQEGGNRFMTKDPVKR
ncbi:MAG TPA: GNAT family N-acetyltransferase [Mobilitalea sp.]|nr:GNAT family N-acetyltransferase [Mobilitalea sp.]